MREIQDDFKEHRALRQKKIRKRRLTAALIFFIIAAVLVGAVMCVTVLFPVEQVTASGSKLYQSDKIVRSSGISKEDNLFVLSEKRVTEALQRALPYIDSVTLERKLPGSIHIKVTDAAEYACYKVGESYYAVSKKGIVLCEYDEQPENLFAIIGCRVVCKVGRSMKFEDEEEKLLTQNLSEYLKLNKIKTESIDVSDKFNITASVDGRFEVQLGNESHLDRKIAHLAGMIKSIEEGRSGKINLSMWSPSKTEGSFTENRE